MASTVGQIPNDRELIESWRDGNVSAGRSLISRHYDSIYMFFRSRFDEEQADDLTQSVFEVLCRKRGGFRGHATVRTYLFAIARIKVMEAGRALKRHRGWMDQLAGSDYVDSVSSAGSRFDRRRTESLVVKALRRLPLEDQVLLELKVYEDLTNRELATVFALPPGTIASRIRSIRRRLGAELTRELSADEATQTLTRLEEHFLTIRADHVKDTN